MCGLVAAFEGSSRFPRERLSRALTSLRHRGPDDVGEWGEGNVFLGHRRLSIIDLETGQQPMHTADDRYVIVFNGEIYNYRELRNELQSKGLSFRTKSDTEVILEGYRCWGTAVVEKLEGMFAFVIWDRIRRVAFVARDRLGIKPICWALRHGSLVVSSTLEPYSVLGGFDEIDPVAIRDLMTFDYIPAPRTIRKGVHKLEPGSRFEWTIGAGTPSIERYWMPPHANEKMCPPSEEELEELLQRCVARQMVSDVPLGVFLSGGIDSSLLVAMMARASDRPVKTFSVAFAEKEFDESAIATRVAAEFGTEHTVIPAQDLDADALRTFIGSLDEPFCDTATAPLHALALSAREHVKVALSGDGADELFGGYEKYLMPSESRNRGPLSWAVHHSLKLMPWRPRGVGPVYDRLLSTEEQIRYSYTRYGDFPVFRKDLRQLLSPDTAEAACVEQFFEPWDRHGRHYGQKLDIDGLMRADLAT